MQTDTPNPMPIGRIASQQPTPTVPLTEAPISREQSAPTLSKTKGKEVLVSDNMSVQGTVETSPEREMGLLVAQGQIKPTDVVQGSQNQDGAGPSNRYMRPISRGRGRGRTYLMPRSSHMNSRGYGRSIHPVLLSTSRHNRIRGIMGRGRGLLNASRSQRNVALAICQVRDQQHNRSQLGVTRNCANAKHACGTAAQCARCKEFRGNACQLQMDTWSNTNSR